MAILMIRGRFFLFHAQNQTITEFKMVKNQLNDKDSIGGRTHGAPYRAHGIVPLRFVGNVVMRKGTQQQKESLS